MSNNHRLSPVVFLVLFHVTIFLPVFTFAGIYYVDQNNPDASYTNAGTEEYPWQTIQYAADSVEPGDTVIVRPGNYGRVKISTSGTPGNTITIKGETFPSQINSFHSII